MSVVESWASGAVSVKTTGALGNGQADDSAAIQRALDAPEPLVLIPPGCYLVGKTLRAPSGKRIWAAPGAVLRLADGAGKDASSFLLTNAEHDGGNERIEVHGGVWDGNNEGNPRGANGDPNAYTGAVMNFVKTRRICLSGLTIRNPDAFSIRIGETSDFVVENIVFDHPVTRLNQDGVHVGGYCENGLIRNLRAATPNTTNDDMVALNADDDVARNINLGMKLGPIRNVTVEGLSGDSVYTFVRLLSVDQPIENIRIRDLSGACRYHAVNLNNWRFPKGVGAIRNVDIRNVHVAKAPGGKDVPLLHICLRVHGLVISDVRRPGDGQPGAPTLLLANDATHTVELAGFQTDALAVAGADRTELAPFISPGGAASHLAAVHMAVGASLCLARGGFARMEMNGRMEREGLQATA